MSGCDVTGGFTQAIAGDAAKCHKQVEKCQLECAFASIPVTHLFEIILVISVNEKVPTVLIKILKKIFEFAWKQIKSLFCLNKGSDHRIAGDCTACAQNSLHLCWGKLSRFWEDSQSLLLQTRKSLSWIKNHANELGLFRIFVESLQVKIFLYSS